PLVLMVKHEPLGWDKLRKFKKPPVQIKSIAET
ncbi:MAG: hypothetical protein RL706_1772, partial [Pseudomonadota bacterium]